MAHKTARQIDDALGNAARIHQFASQNEARYGHQWINVCSGQHVLRNELRIKEIQVEHQSHAGQDQGKRNRHTQDHQTDQGSEKNRENHSAPTCSSRLVVAGACMGSPASRASG